MYNSIVLVLFSSQVCALLLLHVEIIIFTGCVSSIRLWIDKQRALLQFKIL